MKGKLPGNHITKETSKRVGVRPQKETTPENLAFHGSVKITKLKKVLFYVSRNLQELRSQQRPRFKALIESMKRKTGNRRTR